MQNKLNDFDGKQEFFGCCLSSSSTSLIVQQREAHEDGSGGLVESPGGFSVFDSCCSKGDPPDLSTQTSLKLVSASIPALKVSMSHTQRRTWLCFSLHKVRAEDRLMSPGKDFCSLFTWRWVGSLQTRRVPIRLTGDFRETAKKNNLSSVRMVGEKRKLSVAEGLSGLWDLNSVLVGPTRTLADRREEPPTSWPTVVPLIM